MTDNVKKANKYAKDIVSGKIPACRLVIKIRKTKIFLFALMKNWRNGLVNLFNFCPTPRENGR